MEDTFMDIAKVMSKGQVTIPKRIRKLLNLQNGDHVILRLLSKKMLVNNNCIFRCRKK